MDCPSNSERASSRVARIRSPPGTSPTPVRPLLSVMITILRVKNGPWAPLRFSSMLSWPATGMTCKLVMTGAWPAACKVFVVMMDTCVQPQSLMGFVQGRADRSRQCVGRFGLGAGKEHQDRGDHRSRRQAVQAALDRTGVLLQPAEGRRR